MGRDKRKHRVYDEPFYGVVRSIFQSSAYRSLGPCACKLMLDVLSQFQGDNNGDISIPWSRMKKCGWNSKSTLFRAKKELVEAGFIHITRQGRRPSVCQLLALTWFPLDVSRKFDDEAVATFKFKSYRDAVPMPVSTIKKKRDWTLPNGGISASVNASPSPSVHHA
jgi:hypothetical protein